MEKCPIGTWIDYCWLQKSNINRFLIISRNLLLASVIGNIIGMISYVTPTVGHYWKKLIKQSTSFTLGVDWRPCFITVKEISRTLWEPIAWVTLHFECQSASLHPFVYNSSILHVFLWNFTLWRKVDLLSRKWVQYLFHIEFFFQSFILYEQ